MSLAREDMTALLMEVLDKMSDWAEAEQMIPLIEDRGFSVHWDDRFGWIVQ